MTREQIEWVKDLIEMPEGLTDWEYDFVESIAEYHEVQELSPAQEETLNRIAEKQGLA